MASAQAVLANAEAIRDNATIRAPVDGFIDVVNFEIGDELQRTAVVVEVLDPTVPEKLVSRVPENRP